MLTLNQDIELLKNFALKHEGINTFYFGDEWQTDTSVEIVYPLMNAILQGSKLENQMVTRNYLIILSDLVNVDKSNENAVLSDLELICLDLPHYLKQVSKSGLLGAFKVNENVNLTDFTERNSDMVAGHFFDLSISFHIGNYGCNLPIANGNILDSNYIYVGGNFTAGDFLVEIKDQNGNIIQTFNTSGEYVVTVLTGIQQVIGNTSTVITQNIID